MPHIHLAHATDWAGFRAHARALIAQGVPPTQVLWQVAGSQEPDLFAAEPEPPYAVDEQGPAEATLRVPARFIALCQSVILHSDPDRFSLLYGLLWRLSRQAGFRHDQLDAGMTRARLMDHAVHRDLHKMKAFVRFRELPERQFIAWFEPEHHIVEAVAPFFVQRFTAMRWAIATPKGCIAWDGEALTTGPAAQRPSDPGQDPHEGLWLTYYRHIFNPARLKLQAMRKEMPRKYWHNLPEARLIEPLARQATALSEAMVERSVQAQRPGPATPQNTPGGNGGTGA